MAAPSDNLYISDLPEIIDETLLHQIFGAYGTILSSKVLPPKQPGQKGAALVQFGSQQEATWIVDNLHGNMPEGLNEPVSVKYAYNSPGGYGKAGPYAKGSWTAAGSPYDGKGAGKGKVGGGGMDINSLIASAVKKGVLPGGGAKPDDQCVYIKGLPPDTTDLELFKLMAPFGAIAQRGVKAMVHPDGTCTSIGFVDFIEAHAAMNAINSLNGFTLPDGTSLFLKTKDPRGCKGEKGDGKNSGVLSCFGADDPRGCKGEKGDGKNSGVLSCFGADGKGDGKKGKDWGYGGK